MASNTDKFRKGARRFTTTVGVGGVSDAVVTTIPLTSTEGLPVDTAVDITIDRIDSDDNLTLNKEEVVTGVVSGDDLVTCLRGVGGVAQAHAAGAIVEVKLAAETYNDLIDGMLVEHNQDGGHKFDTLMEKTTPVDNDTFLMFDSADTFATRVMSFLNIKAAIGSYLNPIGTIREFNVSTDPAILLGFGTWAAYGAGRVTVGLDAAQTEFNTVDKTGGAKTHTLTTAETPAHTHGERGGEGTLVFHGAGSGTCLGVANGIYVPTNLQSNKYHTNATSTGGDSYGGVDVSTRHTHASVGSGSAHNNLQPYITSYRWVRTA